MDTTLIERIEQGLMRPDTLGFCNDAELRASVAVKEVLTCTCDCEEEIQDCSSCQNKDFIELIENALSGAKLAESPLHGVSHWMGVYRNAVMIAEAAKLHLFNPKEETQGMRFDFTACAMLFALFHDCRRTTDGHDIKHGAFGAMALTSAVSTAGLNLLSPEAAAASFACSLHTVLDYPRQDTVFMDMIDSTTMLSDEAPRELMRSAIGMCLDADRIELLRLGVMPMEEYMYHVDASELVIKHLWKGDTYGRFF